MSGATRELVHEESFDVSAEVLFRALHTPTAIRAWWSASRAIVMPVVGGTWSAAWGEDEDDPDYITAAKIEVFEPPRRMVHVDYTYHSKTGGLPFEADFVTEFQVEPQGAGSRLRVTQRGFPAGSEADEFFAGCAKGWQNTFAGLQRYLSQR